MGLLGLAFHPNYSDNGFIYVYYNDADANGDSTIARFHLETGVSSETPILTLAQPALNHNGGAIAFGADGMLYIGFGDGGGSNDAFANGQNTLSWHGALLRIDVDQEAPYTIPADNPFALDNNFLPEIYAWGLRNPWRWSFDPANGDLWLADVGQNRIEEVNLVNSGDNLGWPIMEGSECFESANCDTTGLTLPVTEYDHSDRDCSITGGYVYRGSDEPPLAGSYIYGDFCSAKIRRTYESDGVRQSEVLINDTGLSIAAFAQDTGGEVYVLNFSGSAGEGIFKLNCE